MTVYLTAVSPLSAGSHEAITYVQWLDSSDSTSNTMSKAQAVDWIEAGNSLVVAGPDGPVAVRVVDGDPPYLRTLEDDTYSDNLLALPRF
jgi:hypothetical protein